MKKRKGLYLAVLMMLFTMVFGMKLHGSDESGNA